jgi:predicted nucleotidyltransferase
VSSTARWSIAAPDLPAWCARLAAELAELPGVVAVVLGGSRASGTHRPDSDWDLDVYYRRAFDPSAVRRLSHGGYVSGLGEWGPVMNGGAWLTVEDTPVDVLFRDLDTVERWLADALEGRFEVLLQNGYLVGAPTYLPIGELAVCRPVSGALPRPDFPEPQAASAAERWRGRAGVALMFAEIHARAADTVPRLGMLACAVLCVAHARLAGRHEWALNEKGLVRRAGLAEVEALIAGGADVAAVSSALGVEPLRRA